MLPHRGRKPVPGLMHVAFVNQETPDPREVVGKHGPDHLARVDQAGVLLVDELRDPLDPMRF